MYKAGEGRCAVENLMPPEEIFPFRWTEISVTARAKFRYHGVKFPLVRKNDSFARPGPLPPVTVVPQRVAPSLAPRREIFPKKTAPSACMSGESSYLCTRFPEGGRARRRPRRSGKKKFRVAGKKFGGSGGNAYLCSPFPPPGAGEPREGRKFRSRGREERSLKELEATQAREAGKEGSLPACRAALAARRGSGDKNQFYNEEFDPGSG